MDHERLLNEILRLTHDHPEVVVELEDAHGRIGLVIFDGGVHPECGGQASLAADAIVRGSIYPIEPYRKGYHRDYEPIAYRLPLSELPARIAHA